VLAAAPTDHGAEPLPLERACPDPLATITQRLPWLGDWLPRPKRVDPFVPARFRVRLLARPSCAGPGCDEALLWMWV
jgi:hypothetical protein